MNAQQFTPFSVWKLDDAREYFSDLSGPAGRYRDTAPGYSMVLRAAQRLMDSTENSIGPLLSVRPGDIPIRYKKVLRYLQERGIIGEMRALPLYNDEPWMYYFLIESPLDTSQTDGNKLRYLSYTFGASRDLHKAISKVIGEFLERYPLLLYRTGDFLRASPVALRRKKIPFIDPAVLSVFSDEQKQNNFHLRFDDVSHFYWVEGKALAGDRRVLLPAQTVFWNYSSVHREFFEPRLREFNTNGASGHFTLDEALLGGIYEIIQRDGFLIYWLNHHAPPQVDVAELEAHPKVPDALKKLLVDCRTAGLTAHILNTTTPDVGVFSCICVIVDDSAIGVKVSIAGGCDTVVFDAIERSIEEALLVFHLSRGRKDGGSPFPFLQEGEYVPFRDSSINDIERINTFANPNMFSKFQFFLKGKRHAVDEVLQYDRRFKSTAEELAHVHASLQRMGPGYEVYYYQPRHEILDMLGYVSVKVVIPQLVGLYLRETNVPLGLHRLRAMPEKLGFRATKEWNPWPHPFP